MNRSRYTRTGARRSGDDYQDLVALEFFLDWLEHPARYDWMALEHDDVGALDDVVAKRNDGTLELYQVKFSTNPAEPEDAWTWEDLLRQEAGKNKPKASLLQKWADGLKRAKKHAANPGAQIVTNRLAAPDLGGCMKDGRVDMAKMPAAHATAARDQLGDDTSVRDFFDGVRFVFGKPDFAKYELSLRTRFRALGGADFRWSDLKETVRAWVRERAQPPPDGTISLVHVRAAAGWQEPRPLPQEFEVPKDYVLPSKEFHDQLLARLDDASAGCVVIQAPPGYGKSTYASYLFRSLRDRAQAVVRHHYFLSLSDRRWTDRLEARSAGESLIHDIRAHHPSLLGSEAVKNPTDADLGRVLDTCARSLVGSVRPLVVILDGLDHVWREKRSIEELENLLRHLLPVRSGVVVVLVTQPIPSTMLPPLIQRSAPQHTWLTLPALEQDGIRRWIQKRRKTLGIARRANHLVESLSEALHRKTSGHPLLVSYCFRALEENGLPATAGAVAALPGHVHTDVDSYYASLVDALPEAALGILRLLATCRFPWPEDGLILCLGRSGVSEADARVALKSVRHLLTLTDLGLRPFHGSLLVHVANAPQHEREAKSWRSHALTWLQNDASTYWRWAFEWLLRAEDGDPALLRDLPDRKWLVEAMSTRKPAADIDTILGRSCRGSASAQETFAGAVRTGLLREYASIAFETHGGILAKLLPVQLKLMEDDALCARLRSRLYDLSDDELVMFARAEDECGVSETPHRILDELQAKRRRSTHLDEYHSSLRRIAVVASIAVDDQTAAVKYATARRDDDAAVVFLEAFSCSLREQGNLRGLKQLLDAGTVFLHQEWSVVMRQALWLTLEQGASMDGAHLTRAFSQALPQVALYRLLKSEPLPVRAKPYPLPDARRLGHREVLDQSALIAGRLEDAFYALLANHAMGYAAANSDWLQTVDDEWLHVLLTYVDDVAAEIATKAVKGQECSADWFIGRFEDAPSWRDGSNFSYSKQQLAQSAGLALRSIAVTLVRIWPGLHCALGQVALASSNGDLFPRALWLEMAATQSKQFTSEALQWLMDEEEKACVTSVAPFQDKAETLANCSKVAVDLGLNERAKALVRASVSNLIAHGHHKDMLLFAPLEMIELCHAAGVGTPETWLLELAPLISRVSDFTDGDETRHLKARLGGALSKIAPGRVPAYYGWFCDNEEWHWASSVLRGFLKSLALDNSLELALARTATDEDSCKLFNELAEQGNAGAQAVIDSHTALFGPGMFQLAQESSDTPSWKKNTPPESCLFPPNKLKPFLDSVDSFDRGAPMADWLRHWSAAGQRDAAFDAGAAMAKAGRWKGISDALYEFSLQHYGKSAAFEWLVRAQREDHGWRAYFTDKKHARARWDAVKRHYPNRWFEFLQASLSGEHPDAWSSLSLGAFELERACEYLLLVGETTLAVELTAAAIREAVSLVPLVLEAPGWQAEAISRNPVMEILVQRLTWPSSLSRERAAVCIAELLLDSKYRKATLEALLTWIGEQAMESQACIGLVPLARARLWDANAELLPIDQIKRALQCPSVLSWLLLREIDPGLPDGISGSLVCEPSIPDDHEPSEFFHKYAESFVPPMYMQRARDLELKTLFPFRRRWDLEWSRIVALEGIEQSTSSARHWYPDEHRRATCFDVPMSEAYRSAYLRALAAGVRGGCLSEEVAIGFGVEACPIDFGLWRVQPSRKPPEWPTLTATTADGIDATPGIVLAKLDDWWRAQRQAEEWVTAAQGRVVSGKLVYELEIQGVFQRCVGSGTPTEEEVAEACLERRPIATLSEPRPSLEQAIIPAAGPSLCSQVHDWQVILASTPLHLQAIPRWQAWRILRGLNVPSQACFGPQYALECTCTAVGAQFHVGGILIGEWRDWTEGVRDRQGKAPPFGGTVLRSPRSLLEAFAQENGMVFCWVCRLTDYPEDQFAGSKELPQIVKVFGASSILL